MYFLHRLVPSKKTPRSPRLLRWLRRVSALRMNGETLWLILLMLPLLMTIPEVSSGLLRLVDALRRIALLVVTASSHP